MGSLIACTRSTFEDVYSNLQQVLSLLSPLDLGHDHTIIAKINMCDMRTPETGTVTHPLFLDAVLHYLREHFENLKIYVVESDATVALADEFIQWLGFVPILRRWDAKFVNLSKIRAVNRRIEGRYLRDVSIPEIFEQPHFFITIPKLKTNPISTITCCLKNQFGCLPVVEKSIYHRHLDDVIADVNKIFRPDICLVDGIIAVGSAQGPSFGMPIPLKTIICSKDPVATDAFCARLMGFQPWLIGHIRKSASSGVGSTKYTMRGSMPDKVDFQIGRLEFRLIKLGGSLQRRAQRRFRATEGRLK